MPGPEIELKIVVGIATAGRPAVLARMLDELAQQTRSPDRIIVCVPTIGDAGTAEDRAGVEVLISERGLTSQRNRILGAACAADVVIFLDDDFVACPDYVAALERTFRQDPHIVIATGRVIADGIGGAGLDFSDALVAIADDHVQGGEIADVYNAYGCNMAVRLSAVHQGNLSFDRQLPLYGWLEDVDFSRQAARFGRIVRDPAARGVHLGVKSGRQSGKRLGYSQIANPLYLMRKGTCAWRKGLYLVARNVLANTGKLFWPEPYVDRAGRCIGNMKAIADLLTGRLAPTRVGSL